MPDIQFPSAFEIRLKQHQPEAWHAFAASHAQPAPTSIRLHPLKFTKTAPGEPIPWTTHGRYLAERPVFTLDPLFHAGTYYVQEASSMLLEQACRQHLTLSQPLKVLDLCAAPGGKSTHLLSLLSGESLLVSNEIIKSRAAILAENIQKWGYPNAAVTSNDPQDFQRLGGFFDVLVVDAPCSGEGLFRKDPQAMNEWSTENAALCASRQKRILADVLPALKEGGILIYATCTYNPEENEQNLLWLQRNTPGMECLPLTIDPSWGVEAVTHQHITGYRAMPHCVRGEGFFLAVMQKNHPADPPPQQSRKKKNNPWPTPAKKLLETVLPWVTTPRSLHFIQRNDVLQCWPTQALPDMEVLAQNLHLITAGTLLAGVKHNKLIPDHALALSTLLEKKSFPAIALEEAQALQYLRKEALPIITQGKGFALVTYQHTPLGWVNVLPNRLNNLYPAAWRIRMRAHA